MLETLCVQVVCARVIYSLNSGRWTTHCFRYTGKNRYYLAHVCQFKTGVTKFGQSHTDLIIILSCHKVVFLLILIQSSHWISSYNIDNL